MSFVYVRFDSPGVVDRFFKEFEKIVDVLGLDVDGFWSSYFDSFDVVQDVLIDLVKKFGIHRRFLLIYHCFKRTVCSLYFHTFINVFTPGVVVVDDFGFRNFERFSVEKFVDKVVDSTCLTYWFEVVGWRMKRGYVPSFLNVLHLGTYILWEILGGDVFVSSILQMVIQLMGLHDPFRKRVYDLASTQCFLNKIVETWSEYERYNIHIHEFRDVVKEKLMKYVAKTEIPIIYFAKQTTTTLTTIYKRINKLVKPTKPLKLKQTCI